MEEDETCPVSAEGGTKRVQLVRKEGPGEDAEEMEEAMEELVEDERRDEEGEGEGNEEGGSGGSGAWARGAGESGGR